MALGEITVGNSRVDLSELARSLSHIKQALGGKPERFSHANQLSSGNEAEGVARDFWVGSQGEPAFKSGVITDILLSSFQVDGVSRVLLSFQDSQGNPVGPEFGEVVIRGNSNEVIRLQSGLQFEAPAAVKLVGQIWGTRQMKVVVWVLGYYSAT